jgi:hypothetical protein
MTIDVDKRIAQLLERVVPNLIQDSQFADFVIPCHESGGNHGQTTSNRIACTRCRLCR